MNIYWAGLLAGFLATLPMTVFMILLHRWLPRKEQYPLPPREITMELADKAGVKPRLDETERTGLTLLAHFAYGTVLGVLYSLFVGPALLKGVAFGLLVWTGAVARLGHPAIRRASSPAAQRLDDLRARYLGCRPGPVRAGVNHTYNL